MSADLIHSVTFSTVASKWARLRPKSPVFRLFTQLYVQAQIKAPCHWPFCGHSPVTSEFPAQRPSNAEMLPFDDIIVCLYILFISPSLMHVLLSMISYYVYPLPYPTFISFCLDNGSCSQRYWLYLMFNTLRPRQKGRHFADDKFTCIIVNENLWILSENSLKFVPKAPVNNIPALVQIMAWRWPGAKPLSEPMMVTFNKIIAWTMITGHLSTCPPTPLSSSILLMSSELFVICRLHQPVWQYFRNCILVSWIRYTSLNYQVTFVT